jgi:hypothetical protein
MNLKKNLDSFYLDYIGWIKTKNHRTLLSLGEGAGWRGGWELLVFLFVQPLFFRFEAGHKSLVCV